MSLLDSTALRGGGSGPSGVEEGATGRNPAASLQLHRLLVIDDEQIILAGLATILAHEGYQVVTATDALAALEELKQQPFSVIISDYRMPKLTGLEFLAQAKQIQPDATRILITGVLSLDTMIGAINRGEIYRFVVKPWLREELIATVKNAVQRYELIRGNAVLRAEARAMSQQLKSFNQSLELQMARAAEQNEHLAALNEAVTKHRDRHAQLGLQLLQHFYPTVGNPARRVHELCKVIAKTLNLPTDQSQILETSAWLYDIGLVGMRRRVVRRWQAAPASLTPEEMTLVQSHPIRGQNLVRPVDHFEEVGAIIRTHHERFDGTGFPDQLKAGEIPWLGRLLAVAVGYVEGQAPAAAAVEAVRRASGRAYDPEAVRIFLQSLPGAARSRQGREIKLSELQPGMVLAKGIYTATGLLLIPEGQLLSPAAIAQLRNHTRTDLLGQTLMVYG